jgi:hypothetical protein
MSKTKNTPEFQKMMDDIELANSFHYAEQEMEKQEVLRDLQAQDAINQAVNEYIEAQKVFIEAQDKFKLALDAYKEYKGGLTSEEEELNNTTDTLRDMFAGFNPNA